MDLTLLGALDTGMIIQYLFVLVMLVAMEGLLSADNALVLAVMVRPLSPKLRSKALFYGLIGAVVRMLPTKSVQDLQLKSLKKKFKDKKFAAGCSREVIERGADMLGWTLDELMEQTIAAMQASPAANGN